MRVATFATHDRAIAAALKTQARMAEIQLQQASGSVSTDYAGLGTSARRVLDLEASQKRATAYADAATEAAGRVEVIYSTLSTITDLLSEFRSELTSALSTDTSDTGTLATAAEGYLQELASLLNSTYEGRYLFSGDATQTAPVDLTDYATDGDTASTSYYQGDTSVTAVRISREQTVSYGVTADNAAFEQAFRALGIIAAAGDDADEDLISEAYALVESALDATVAVQAKVSVDASTLERAVERQTDYQSMLTAAISELTDVDATEAAVRLTSYETQLEASYSAIAKVQSLNLLDYLR